jgi:CRP-like cAMP-binding protein
MVLYVEYSTRAHIHVPEVLIMNDYISILENCPLFAGIDPADLPALLKCLSADRRTYQKGAFVFTEEDKPERVGVVLSGSVYVMHEDYYGNRTILDHVNPGNVFGESFACAEVDRLPVSVVATTRAEILLTDCKRILTTCSSACVFHAGLIKNLTLILAGKNVALTQKMQHVTQRSTREKALSYLSETAKLMGSSSFVIPFTQQELADYLAVERSGLSMELSRLRKEGVIRYRGNHFEIL